MKPPSAAEQISGSQLLHEALDKLAQPALRDEIIARALAIIGASAVPDEIQQLAALVGGPLFDTVAVRLGEQAALGFIEDLAPIIRKATPTTAVRPVSDVRRRHDRATLPPPGAKWVVLADDDESLLAVAARGLRRAGHRVITANDGHLALAACRQHVPDLVITDLNMPTMSGLHLAWLLALSYGPDGPPVIVWTGAEPSYEAVPGNVLCTMAKGDLRQLLEAADLVLVKGADWTLPSR